MGELGDLLELLYRAHGRYRTVRPTLRTWEHLERSRAAFERAHEPGGRRGIFLNLTGAAPRPRAAAGNVGVREPVLDRRRPCPRGDRGRSAREDPRTRRGHLVARVSAPRAAHQPFRLFVPGRLGEGWRFGHAVHFPASERPEAGESVTLVHRHALGSHDFYLHEATRPHPWLGSEELRTVEKDGLVMKTIEPDAADAPMPRHVLVERDGTHVNVHPHQLPLEELIAIAASLVPAPETAPPAVEG